MLVDRKYISVIILLVFCMIWAAILFVSQWVNEEVKGIESDKPTIVSSKKMVTIEPKTDYPSKNKLLQVIDNAPSSQKSPSKKILGKETTDQEIIFELPLDDPILLQ